MADLRTGERSVAIITIEDCDEIITMNDIENISLENVLEDDGHDGEWLKCKHTGEIIIRGVRNND